MNINTLTHYSWVIITLAILSLAGSFYWKHSQYVKDQIANIKRHKKLFTFTAIVTLALIYTFHINYTFVNPIVARSAESYTEVWNDRAICLQSLDEAQTAIHANNLAATADFNN